MAFARDTSGSQLRSCFDGSATKVGTLIPASPTGLRLFAQPNAASSKIKSSVPRRCKNPSPFGLAVKPMRRVSAQHQSFCHVHNLYYRQIQRNPYSRKPFLMAH
jgi:hypothetical protein